MPFHCSCRSFSVEVGKLLSCVIICKLSFQDLPQQVCIVAYFHAWCDVRGVSSVANGQRLRIELDSFHGVLHHIAEFICTPVSVAGCDISTMVYVSYIIFPCRHLGSGVQASRLTSTSSFLQQVTSTSALRNTCR